MKNNIKSIIGLGFLLALPAMAEEYVSAEREDRQGVTILSQEKIGILPAAGALVFDDAAGDMTSRFAAALLLQMNAMTSFGPNSSDWFLGPATGVVYSNQGSSDQLMLIPANLKMGYAFNGTTRLSIHGGANALYRSATFLGSGSDWRMDPNVGADLEASLGRNVSLLLRPDATITDGNDLYTGLVGVSVAIR